MEAGLWNSVREGRRTGKAEGSHPLSAAILGMSVCLSWCMWFNTFNLGSLFVQGNGFCFHSLVARPVDHIDHGGAQTRHEASWAYSCLPQHWFWRTHAEQSSVPEESVTFASSFFFLDHPLCCFSPLSENWLVKTQHPVVTWGMYCVKALQTSGFCFSSSSAFSAYLWFYLYILLLSLLIPLAVTAASRTNEGDRALHILPWTPGQVPQQRTQFLWAACVHCWSDILHKRCHCSDMNIFFSLNG